MLGITVSVNYADHLAATLGRWCQGCGRVWVVTDHRDTETPAVAACHANAHCIHTDAFYANGAAFDKGGALWDVWLKLGMHGEGWVCMFDADILPPDGWAAQLPPLDVGNLYGAHRWQGRSPADEGRTDLRAMNDREFPGYFWIFHTDDPHLPGPPVFTSWQHAGGYDTDFQAAWPDACKIRLPLRLLHIGQDGQNWWGRGKPDAMRAMYEERRRRGGGYDHERTG